MSAAAWNSSSEAAAVTIPSSAEVAAGAVETPVAERRAQPLAARQQRGDRVQDRGAVLADLPQDRRLIAQEPVQHVGDGTPQVAGRHGLDGGGGLHRGHSKHCAVGPATGRPRWSRAGHGARRSTVVPVVMDRDAYLRRWRALHGGTHANALVSGWLSGAHALARPLAGAGVPPAAVTLAGGALAVLAAALAVVGGRGGAAAVVRRGAARPRRDLRQPRRRRRGHDRAHQPPRGAAGRGLRPGRRRRLRRRPLGVRGPGLAGPASPAGPRSCRSTCGPGRRASASTTCGSSPSPSGRCGWRSRPRAPSPPRSSCTSTGPPWGPGCGRSSGLVGLGQVATAVSRRL